MTKRIKLIGASVATRADMEDLVGRIVELTILRDAHKVDMDDQIAGIRKSYETRLANAESEIERLTTIAKTWAENHPEEFGNKKSLEMVQAVVGFRTGTPKLKTLAKWTWDKVKTALIERGMGFVRTKTEVDKDALLAKREQLGNELACVGLKVVQDEAFYIEPKRELLSGRIAV